MLPERVDFAENESRNPHFTQAGKARIGEKKNTYNTKIQTLEKNVKKKLREVVAISKKSSTFAAAFERCIVDC